MLAVVMMLLGTAQTTVQTTAQPGGGATPAAPAPSAASVPAPVPAPAKGMDPGLAQELTALSPDSPRAYFLLAERVADVASERSDDSLRRLARQLAVLSYELTKRGGGGGGAAGGGVGGSVDDSARSVCLLLASIAPSVQEARWLRALAGTFDRDILGAVYDPPGTGPSRDEAALDAATVLGLVRTGQGRRAEQRLKKPGVEELLQRHEKLLSPAGMSGEFDRLRRTMADWPTCPQCRGKRAITRTDNNGRLAGVTLCDTCGGQPGPRIPLSELVLQLRLEALLLSGIQRSWSGQILIDNGAPMRELDADELAARLGIDPLKPLWRDGVWTAPEGAAPASVEPKTDGAEAPAGEPNSAER